MEMVTIGLDGRGGRRRSSGIFLHSTQLVGVDVQTQAAGEWRMANRGRELSRRQRQGAPALEYHQASALVSWHRLCADAGKMLAKKLSILYLLVFRVCVCLARIAWRTTPLRRLCKLILLMPVLSGGHAERAMFREKSGILILIRSMES
jgi:YD repeat-containing protein